MARLNRHVAWIVLLAGLLVTFIAAWSIKSGVDRITEHDFADHGTEIEKLILNRLDDHERILRSGAALFRVSDRVSRETWRIFNECQAVEQQLPGIQGIGFSLLIPKQELSRHIREVREDGFPDYTVKPAGERDIYTSIIYLEPFTGRNLRAFGYDMFSEPVRRAAMEQARDTNAAALSGKVILVQETQTDVQAGALMYIPVYRNGLPIQTVEQRRAAIVGWVYSPYRMTDLLRGILGAGNPSVQPGVRLDIYDGAQPAAASLLYTNHPEKPGDAGADGCFVRRIPIHFHGHLWFLVLARPHSGVFTVDYTKAWLVLFGGILIFGLLHALILILLNTRARAQRMAAALTIDLKRSEDSLKQTTERLTLATKAGGVGIWDYDVVHNHLAWDEQMFRLYGITADQFGGAYEAWQQGLHPEDRQRGDREISMALDGSQDFNIEFRVVWPDGTLRHIRGFATVQRDGAGRAIRMIGTNWDITAQKQAAEALRESEANFRTFFESMTDMILVSTPEGRVLYTNSAVTRTLGYPPGEIEDMHLLDLHPPELRQEAAGIFSAMFRGERENCPLPLLSRDGIRVPVETRVWFGKWSGNACVFGICKNLTTEQEAQQRFERLFRHNPSLMALSDLQERRFSDVNDAFLTTLGYARDEVVGHAVSDIGLFISPEQHAVAMNRLLADGRLVDFELQVRHKDGALIDGLFSGEIISSQSRRYILTVMTDITARKRAEAEVARLSVIQQSLVALATQFVNVPLELQDAAIEQSLAVIGQLIDADRAYLFTYDFERQVMTNTHEWCNEGIMPEIDNLQDEPTGLFQDWVDAHRLGELVLIPSVAALPPASRLRLSLESQGIKSLVTLPLMQGDACLGFVGFDAVRSERIWQDEEISLLRVLAEVYAHFKAHRAIERETLALQQRLTQARDEAQSSAEAKSLFLANMSHEIRTPLNALLGYAQIMESECYSCPKGHRLSAITRSANHLLELLTDLLELVRSDTRTIPVVPVVFDFRSVIEDVLMMFAQQAEAKGLVLELVMDSAVPQAIRTDAGKIRQVLVNLLGNAVKFTDSGRVCLRAAAGPGSQADEMIVTVTISDTGSGMNESEMEGVFDIFGQAHQRVRSGQGTGLGLPLSRRYANALGGDITVDSHPGEGSHFRFTFMAGKVGDEVPVTTRQGCVLRLVPGRQACRVLVVDDDPENRDMLANMLSMVGFTVQTVASASEALRRLARAHRVDLVLMDKLLPDLDGYEAINRLRRLPGGKDLSVLVVSASGFADEKMLALDAGADGYVAKPVRREVLLEEIARVVGVRYEHEPAPTRQTAVPTDGLAAAARTILPQALRDILNQALRTGDILLLRETIAATAGDHAELAEMMGALVKSYDYDGLQRLLNPAQADPS